MRVVKTVPCASISSAFQPPPMPNRKPSAAHLIDRGDQLRRLDRIALDDQADAGGDLQPLGGGRGRGQGDERIHHVVVALRQFAAAGRRGAPRHRDVRVLRCPQRIETTLLQRDAEFGGEIE